MPVCQVPFELVIYGQQSSVITGLFFDLSGEAL